MISFRCSFCNKAYIRPEATIGRRFVCPCGQKLKVPRRSGGNAKAKSLTDWLVEAVVYGGGGALLGFGLATLIVGRVWVIRRGDGMLTMIVGLTLVGFLLGVFTGERGVNFVGRLIRERERNG